MIRGAPVVVVRLMDGTDPFGQCLVSRFAGGAVIGTSKPGVERGTRDLNDRAQPLHRIGVEVVGAELEAAHQFVSPAKYLAADRRMSRSVDNRVLSARSCPTSARSRASSWSGGFRARYWCGTSGGGVAVPNRHPPSGLAPGRQRHPTDAEFVGDLGDRRALSVSVQRHRVPLELVGIIFSLPSVSIISLPPPILRDSACPTPGGVRTHTRYVATSTYLPLATGGNLYLATVIDCCSRRVAGGWAIADHMRTELVEDALKLRSRCGGAAWPVQYSMQITEVSTHQRSSRTFAAIWRSCPWP